MSAYYPNSNSALVSTITPDKENVWCPLTIFPVESGNCHNNNVNNELAIAGWCYCATVLFRALFLWYILWRISDMSVQLADAINENMMRNVCCICPTLSRKTNLTLIEFPASVSKLRFVFRCTFHSVSEFNTLTHPHHLRGPQPKINLEYWWSASKPTAEVQE